MSRHYRHVFVIASVCAFGLMLQTDSRSGDVVSAADANSSPETIATFATTKESNNNRVTILGVTKGMSLLDTQQLVSDGGRKHGENVVRWMQIAVLVENVSKAPLAFEAETADGRPLVDKIVIAMADKQIASRSRTRKSLPLDFAGLGSAIFPVAPPATDNPEDSRVFVFTLSGNLQHADTATFRFRFGKETEQSEITFNDVPMP